MGGVSNANDDLERLSLGYKPRRSILWVKTALNTLKLIMKLGFEIQPKK